MKTHPWTAQASALADFAAKKALFFIGGAPRSGTTWLQQILDSHPQISCKGEGLFWRTLAAPLDEMITARKAAIEAKNTGLFAHTGGYRLPDEQHADLLLGTAVLAALAQQEGAQACRAVGEKTPENIFLFPRLKLLFPRARLIGIARDPRDVIASAWHFFQKAVPAGQEEATKCAFVEASLPAIADGLRAMIAYPDRYGADYTTVTYERLCADPAGVLGALTAFLGLAQDDETTAACVETTRFAALSGGRQPGEVRNGAFFRSGQPGTWRDTLSPAMAETILRRVGYTFAHFGWSV